MKKQDNKKRKKKIQVKKNILWSKKLQGRFVNKLNFSFSNETDDETCLVCTESYLKNILGEEWIQYATWTHSKCIKDNNVSYIYYICNSDNDSD